MHHLTSYINIFLVISVPLLRLPVDAFSLLSVVGPRPPLATGSLQSQIPITTAAHRGRLELRHQGIQRTRRQSIQGTDPERDELEVVYIDTSQDDIPEDLQAELLDNQPSEWVIMKEVRVWRDA